MFNTLKGFILKVGRWEFILFTRYNLSYIRNLSSHSIEVFLIIFILILSMSCTNSEFKTVEDYFNYLNVTDFINQTIEKDELEVTISYRPIDYIILKALRNKPLERNSIDSLIEKYSNYSYFVLSISDRNKEFLDQNLEGYETFSKRLNLLAFNFNDVIKISTDKKMEIEIQSFQLLRTFGISNRTEVIFCISN
ncbi:MAG: hypothetical protein ACK57K_07310, partial [Chryseotalea sp.]